MTNAEILLTVFSEATGRPRSAFEPALAATRAAFPHHGLDDELPDDVAQALLAGLRKEKQGILNWLAEGAMIARRSRWARRN
jgi:hypothetical protein